MIIIGITGEIGSGKSFVLNVFKKMGYKTFDCDKYVNYLIHNNKLVQAEIIKNFKNIEINGKINKNLLKQKIFNNYDKNIKILEDIIHPHVILKIKKIIFWNKFFIFRKIILEVPLLFETNIDKLCNYKILIVANKEIQINRILHRDNISFDNLYKIIKKQKSLIPLNKKKELADFVIDTSYLNFQTLKNEIKNILKKIK